MRSARTVLALPFCLAISLSLTASAATQPPATTPKPAAPATGTGPPPLTKLAMTGQGFIKETVRKSVRDSDVILQTNWPYMAGGPHLCSLYSLGKKNVDPSKFMLVIKHRPDAVIGMMDDEAETPDVAKGSRYLSHQLGKDITLVVTAESPCCFMLQDESHARPGAVVYGALQDGSGELWVYEECLGSYFTDPGQYVGMHNDKMVPTTQKYFQAILNAYFDVNPPAASGGAPCPANLASHYKAEVNGPVNTGIKVTKGDKLAFQASGEVTFGIMAGSGGPAGIDFITSYNYFTDLKHGCLIGRIRTSMGEDSDPWTYIGEGLEVTADRSGVLELNVNDNDPNNNSGDFNVDITVCKQH